MSPPAGEKMTADFGPPSPPERAMIPGIKRDAEALSSSPEISPETAPAQLTIFYGGGVHVYDNVTVDKAQAIMLLAGESCLSAAAMAAKHPRQSRTDLPIVRRNSLRQFLQKRKNRKINNSLHASSSTDST